MILIRCATIEVWTKFALFKILTMRAYVRATLTAASLLLTLVNQISAQNNVGIGTTTPNPSAILELSALDRGFLVPRTDTLSVTNPATGLLIYTPWDSVFWYFDGIFWRQALGQDGITGPTGPTGAAGPTGPTGPLLPATFGQTLYWDTISTVGWLNNSFLWNSGSQVSVNNPAPDPSAIFQIDAELQGFLPPRLSRADRDNIPAPALGLVVFNTTDSTLDYWNGTCWLASFQQNCSDCVLNVTPSATADTIDRVVADSVQFTIDIVQPLGLPQNIAINLSTTLPPGVTATIDPNPITAPGTSTVTFHASPFAAAGTFPVVFQVLCGGATYNIVYSLTILPCYVVDVNNSTQNYDLSAAFYAQNPGAPTTTPVCIVNNIGSGVSIESPTTAQPAYTTGALPAGSLVAIVNNGNVIGKGGDGGDATDPAQGWVGNGENGGDAINLTLDADVINNFNIYGGGGGGNAMAFAISTGNLIPAPAPAFGFFIGSGGGGGAGGGEGGDLPPGGLIGLSWYTPGGDGTSGQFGVEGQGGILNFPIDFNVGPAQVTLNPNTVGGDGGPYGYPGTSGIFQLSITVSVVINIPFIGPVVIPVVSGLNIPIPVTPPTVGQGGYAIKRNGFVTTIPDNLYNTSNLRGQVGP